MGKETKSDFYFNYCAQIFYYYYHQKYILIIIIMILLLLSIKVLNVINKINKN